MDFAQAKIVEQGNNLYVTHGDDSRLYVEFENRPVHQEFQSEEEGRPIYKDVPYINIMFPGDKTKQICRPVKLVDDMSGPSDPTRFPRQWALFQEQKEQVQTGTPVSEWGPVTRSQAMELKGMHIHTVEQLAGLADGALNWMGSRELREKAKTWLENAKGGAEALRLQHENEILRADMDALKVQMRELVEATKAPAAEKGKKAA